MTINLAEGKTFDKVGLYLPGPVFSHGQLYFAMSRTTSFDTVKIEIVPKTNKTSIVVYREDWLKQMLNFILRQCGGRALPEGTTSFPLNFLINSSN